MKEKQPFFLVVEPQEHGAYLEHFPRECILTLPFRDRGSVIPARNWIKEHSIKNGDRRHWQLDDNISYAGRRWKGYRIRCDCRTALYAAEQFIDRYQNIAVGGLNYEMFVVPGSPMPPFALNVHVYSCSLIQNDIPHTWRGRYNEDTDLCLQVLADKWCTVLFNAFFIKKIRTMLIKGGNTDTLDYKDDGRVKMARALEREWPGVSETKRRFRRPQHVIAYNWRKFDTLLERKADINIRPGVDEFGMRLVKLRELKNDPGEPFRDVVDEHIRRYGEDPD